MKQINIKVDVPEGFVLDKVETSGDNIVATIKEKFVPKKGDICVKDRHIFIFSHTKEVLSPDAIFYFVLLSHSRGYLSYNDVGIGRLTGSDTRPATPSEAQQLFDALAKEGKKWNPETLQIEDIEKDIIVPDCIRIYTTHDGKLELGINSCHILTYDDTYETWSCMPYYSEIDETNPIKCKVVEVAKSSLSAGDICVSVSASMIHTFGLQSCFDRYEMYSIVLKNGFVSYSVDGCVLIESLNEDDLKFFKVVPVK